MMEQILLNSFYFCDPLEKHNLSSFGFRKSCLEVSCSVWTSFTSSSILGLLVQRASPSQNFFMAHGARESVSLLKCVSLSVQHFGVFYIRLLQKFT